MSQDEVRYDQCYVNKANFSSELKECRVHSVSDSVRVHGVKVLSCYTLSLPKTKPEWRVTQLASIQNLTKNLHMILSHRGQCKSAFCCTLWSLLTHKPLSLSISVNDIPSIYQSFLLEWRWDVNLHCGWAIEWRLSGCGLKHKPLNSN